MSHLVQVTFKHGPALPVESGTTLKQVLREHPETMEGIDFPVLGALVNNEFVSVEYRLETDSDVQLLGYRDSYGLRVYRHTIAFLLAKVAHETFPGCDFAVEHSLSKGLYCSFRRTPEDTGIKASELAALQEGLQKLLDDKVPIDRMKVTFDEAIKHFEEAGATDKLNLLRFKNSAKVRVYMCGDYMDLANHPLACNAGDLGDFKLVPYQVGFVILGPDRADPTTFPAFDPAHYIYDATLVYSSSTEPIRVMDTLTSPWGS